MRAIQLTLALALSLGLTGPVLAAVQGKSANDDGQLSYLPIWNSQGKVEALLLLDSKQLRQNDGLNRLLSKRPEFGSALQWNWGKQTVRAGVITQAQPSLGVFCTGSRAGSAGFSSLSGCRLTQLGSSDQNSFSAIGQYQVGRATVSASAGAQRSRVDDTRRSGVSLDALGFGTQLQQESVGISGQLPIGEQTWISIGGNVTQARIVPASQIPGGLPTEWNTNSLKLSAGTSRVSGELIGSVTEVPGQNQTYSSLGVGVTFKTPWQGRISVGAEDLFGKGQNPLNPLPKQDEGTLKGSVPFLRYEQDL